MDGFKQECKLCDDIISDDHFKVIDDVTKNILNVLSLKLTLNNEIQNVMCTKCSSKLLAAWNFKSECLNKDKTMVPFVDLEDLKEKTCKQGISTLDDLDVCRLCLQPKSSDYKSIQEVPVDNIQLYIPEINFAITTNPAICSKCQDALHVHSTFIRNCSEVEKQRHMDSMGFRGIFLTDPCIKTEEIEIKPEPVDEETLFEIICDIKKEELDEGDTSLKQTGAGSTNRNYNCKECIHKTTSEGLFSGKESRHKTDSEIQVNKRDRRKRDHSQEQMYSCTKCSYNSIGKCNLTKHQFRHKDPSELQTFKCDECDYKTVRKDNLARHTLRWHRDDSKVQVYDYKSIKKGILEQHPSQIRIHKCNKCDFTTKHKTSLKQHQLRHKDPSEIKMFACDECTFITKRKASLRQHYLQHKDPSQVQMYKCDECDYKSIRKDHLKSHQLSHKDPSQVRTFKCDTCDYECLRKDHLKSHQWTHKDSLEVPMHKCDECDYKSIRKDVLKQHQLRWHKDPSEVPVFKCDECDYKCIEKGNLLKHQLRHKDPSEVRVFKCDKCDYKSIRKHDLRKHVLRHKDLLEVQTYGCNECDYKCTRKSYLKRHLLTHKNDKGNLENPYGPKRNNIESKCEKFEKPSRDTKF